MSEPEWKKLIQQAAAASEAKHQEQTQGRTDAQEQQSAFVAEYDKWKNGIAIPALIEVAVEVNKTSAAHAALIPGGAGLAITRKRAVPGGPAAISAPQIAFHPDLSNRQVLVTHQVGDKTIPNEAFPISALTHGMVGGLAGTFVADLIAERN